MEAKINKFFSRIKDIFNKIGKSLKPVWGKVSHFFVIVGKFIAKYAKIFKDFVRKIFFVMSKIEKNTIFILLAVIIALCGYQSYTSYMKQTNPAPTYGGKYIEGMVAENKTDTDQVVQKLTKIGLVYFDKDSNIKPAISKKWEISEDGKTYTFFLADGIDSKTIADTAKNHGNDYADITIETPEPNIIKFTLKEVYSPFLANCAQPIYDYGPYELKKQE